MLGQSANPRTRLADNGGQALLAYSGCRPGLQCLPLSHLCLRVTQLAPLPSAVGMHMTTGALITEDPRLGWG